MPCLGTIISFGNLKIAQSYYLANLKFSNLDLNQYHSIVFKVLKIENLRTTIQTLSFSNLSFIIS